MIWDFIFDLAGILMFLAVVAMLFFAIKERF